jgi:hypothetical protein
VAGPAYLSRNELATSTGLSSSTEDASFPRDFIKDSVAGNPFKWTEFSGGIHFEIDFGAARSNDTLAIINHNFPSDTTFLLKADASTPPTTVRATPIWKEFNLWIGFVAASFRYWRLEITLGAGADNAEIGEMYLGTRVELTSRRSFGFDTGVIHRKESHETIRGCKHNFSLYDRGFFSVLFRKIRDPMIAELDALERAVNGSREPFIWIPNTVLTDAFMVRKMGDHRELTVAMNEWDVDLDLEEESTGKVRSTNV